MWCVIGSDELCSEWSARVRSALRAGKRENPAFFVCVGLNRLLKLDNITLTHLIAKGMGNKFRWRRSRNVLWCVEDGSRGVCSSDVHRLVQKPVSATQMQFTHATRSPRGCQIAGRVVCRSLPLELAHEATLQRRNRLFHWYLKPCTAQQ